MSIESLPLVSPGPRAIARPGKRKSRGGQTQNIQDQCFAIPCPAILDKPRLRFPSVCDCKPPVLRPTPVSSCVKRFSKTADLALAACLAIEIHCTRKRTGQQVSRIDG